MPSSPSSKRSFSLKTSVKHNCTTNRDICWRYSTKWNKCKVNDWRPLCISYFGFATQVQHTLHTNQKHTHKKTLGKSAMVGKDRVPYYANPISACLMTSALQFTETIYAKNREHMLLFLHVTYLKTNDIKKIKYHINLMPEFFIFK